MTDIACTNGVIHAIILPPADDIVATAQGIGESVTVDLSDGVKINEANVTMANVLTKNGVIHVIDAVLLPE